MSSFDYIAILGRQPEFGLVELESLFGADGLEPLGRAAALVREPLDIARLGGSVKLGRILYDGPVVGADELPAELVAGLPMRESKTPVAVSWYGVAVSARQATAAALSLKKRMRERGSVRVIVPGEGAVVSAAQLNHNRVLERGFELLVIVNGQRMVAAQTTAVQDIDWYSRRDYGRPARSAKVGMLPPKLAQVLVNSTSAAVVADPFCGSGVVLAEALLVGRAAHGSDVASEMVGAAQSNLQWLAQQPEAASPLPAWRVAEADARTVRLPADCAVVSEGYLGPHLVHSPAPAELVAVKRDILVLYRESLTNWAKQLPSGAEVSLCVPAWRIGKRWDYLDLVDELPNLGYTSKSFAHVRTPLLYARESQLVGRQLLFMRKS